MNALNELASRYQLFHRICGKGLMIGMQFGPPQSLPLGADWRLLHKMNKDLFCQMITIPPLERDHNLTQVAGHGTVNNLGIRTVKTV